MRHAVLSALSLILILIVAAPAAAGARLEVLPGQANVRPGHRIRLTAIAWIGAEDKPVATMPPRIEWSTSAGQIDSQGLLMIPSQAPDTITVQARVGSLVGTSILKVRRHDLVVLPAEVRVLTGQALRFTLLDFSGGHAKTPETVVFAAERGLVDSQGRYTAPKSPGPDSITVILGGRTAKAQILVVTSPGKSSGKGPKSDPKASPSPGSTPGPATKSGAPWKVKSWSSTGGFSSKNHRIVVEILHPKAARLKAFTSKVGGSEVLASARTVKPGEKCTISLTLTLTHNSARIVLYDTEGKVLASRRRGK